MKTETVRYIEVEPRGIIKVANSYTGELYIVDRYVVRLVFQTMDRCPESATRRTQTIYDLLMAGF